MRPEIKNAKTAHHRWAVPVFFSAFIINLFLYDVQQREDHKSCKACVKSMCKRAHCVFRLINLHFIKFIALLWFINFTLWCIYAHMMLSLMHAAAVTAVSFDVWLTSWLLACALVYVLPYKEFFCRYNDDDTARTRAAKEILKWKLCE